LLTLSPELASQLGIRHTQGLLVLAVPAGGREDRAGMAPGDVVVGSGGRPVRTPENVAAIVGPKPRGTRVPVTLFGTAWNRRSWSRRTSELAGRELSGID
jgi:S1-C subfamily serine protease